ncbi:MAG: glycosyltransferase family 9 protein [bacterium]|nr:glycosyltransferase family 9 protein [bacterium]
MQKKESTLLKWLPFRNLINFKVFVYIGGGLGDISHHYATNRYLRRLKSIKEFFPNLYLYLYLDSKNPILVKQLFEKDPYIDEIIAVKQENFIWSHVQSFMEDKCKIDKVNHAQFMSEFDSEIVFRRTLNRVFILLRFPRIRAISMDDFFQQFCLDIEDFKPEWPAKIWIEKEYEDWTEDYLKKVKDKKLIGFHPFAEDSRNVYSEKKWIELINLATEQGFVPVIFGSQKQQDSEIYKQFSELSINLISELSIRKKIAILKQCSFYIGLDAGIKDLAFIYAIPCIILSDATESYALNPSGYLWAYAWKENFVKVLFHPQSLEPKYILTELFKLEGSKGKWKKQLASL